METSALEAAISALPREEKGQGLHAKRCQIGRIDLEALAIDLGQPSELQQKLVFSCPTEREYAGRRKFFG